MIAQLYGLEPDHPLLLELHGFWINEKYLDDFESFSKVLSERLRTIGFHTEFETAEDFLTDLIKGFREQI